MEPQHQAAITVEQQYLLPLRSNYSPRKRYTLCQIRHVENSALPLNGVHLGLCNTRHGAKA